MSLCSEMIPRHVKDAGDSNLGLVSCKASILLSVLSISLVLKIVLYFSVSMNKRIVAKPQETLDSINTNKYKRKITFDDHPTLHIS